jgi:hypothetical protein
MFTLRPFNPYQEWLQLPGEERPGNLYQLLAIRPCEQDCAVIAAAIARQKRRFAGAPTKAHAAIASRIATELRLAEQCLLNPVAKAEYDRRLRGERPARARWRVSKRMTLRFEQQAVALARERSS